MTSYQLIATIITLALFFGYINHRFIRLQTTIAMMIGSLLLAAVLTISSHSKVINPWFTAISNLTDTIDFNSLLLHGMLGLLLFAGAMAIDLEQLKKQKAMVFTLASVGTIASTVLVATLTWYLLKALHIPFPYIYACLFGALISPTDPIAVLNTFKRIKAPKSLTACVAGESLFNDGVGIVIFLTLYDIASPLTATQELSLVKISVIFLQEAMGGLAFGYLISRACIWLIRPIKDINMIILITLAITTGGYTFANTIGFSGPLAMVVCGIMIGSSLRSKEKLHPTVALFWELIDEILNVILFLLLGFDILSIHFNTTWILASLLIIPLVLLVRLFTVSVPLKLFQSKKRGKKQPWMIAILTWGGLRGGLAVALALSTPPSPYRDLILSLTYAVVIFSVIIQGITISPLAKAASKAEAEAVNEAHASKT